MGKLGPNSIDLPGYSGSPMGARDAVFTVALLVWWAVAGAQPYDIAGTRAHGTIHVAPVGSTIVDWPRGDVYSIGP